MTWFNRSRLRGLVTGLVLVILALWGVEKVRSLLAEGGYSLTWWTVDGGGVTFSTGGSYQLGSTAGQPDAGGQNGGSFALNGGFWPAAAISTTPTLTPTAGPSPTATATATATSTGTPTPTPTGTPGVPTIHVYLPLILSSD